MSSLSIGLTGLLVNQRLLDLTGQNIDNVNTPGYHKQVATLAENPPTAETGTAIGSGVQMTGITREFNQVLEQAIVGNTSASNQASTQLDGLNQLQSYLATGSGTLHDALGNLFSQLEALSTNPGDPTQRQVTLSAASDVTTQLNATINNLQQMSSGLVDQANTHVSAINNLAGQIASLNQQIHDATVAGGATNGLLDQRDQALGSLAELVGVRTVPQSYGELSIFVDGSPLVLGNQAATLSASIGDQGQIVISSSQALAPITISGGQLGADLTLHNATMPAVQAQLNTFTQELTRQFDHVHATGMGLGGPMTALASQRAVSDVNQPLANANLGLPPQAGDLYITVTNLATGQKTLNKVAIDPATQSLTAVAAAISAVPNVQGVVDPQSGTLHLLAKPGYGFDFTGTLSTSPDTQTISGTTAATIGGQYTGTADDTLHFSFTGSGTIGVTPNLTLEVRNGAGTLLGSLNVGQGYTPGTDLSAPLGVKLNLAAGTGNAGDAFTVNVAANPDSANLLTALGLNTFFVGSSAGDLAVNPDIVNDPLQLALGTSGQAGDSSNLAKLSALQTEPVLANQTQTLQQYLENIIGSVGTQANDVQTNSTAYAALGQQLNQQQQSVSGVDPNEALMQLVQYQRSYQMSAQFISAVNQTMQSLFNIYLPNG
jgi:flagellar hook-associated protein 1 FlgK